MLNRLHLIKRKSSPTSSEVITDEEFGHVSIKRIRRPVITYKISTNGSISVYAPRMVLASELKHFIDANRNSIRTNLHRVNSAHTYKDGDRIGHQHILRLQPGVRWYSHIGEHEITIKYPSSISDSVLQQKIRTVIEKCLRQEASSYLRRRLYQLATKYGFTIDINKFRTSHAKTRWGSCSSTGTISLNIMLMTLPDDLCDYVILHELTHTKHMNHSAAFWRDLEKVCPGAKDRRERLKKFSPYL